MSFFWIRCSASFLVLGLPPGDPFWSAPPADWTAKALGTERHATPTTRCKEG